MALDAAAPACASSSNVSRSLLGVGERVEEISAVDIVLSAILDLRERRFDNAHCKSYKPVLNLAMKS